MKKIDTFLSQYYYVYLNFLVWHVFINLAALTQNVFKHLIK